MKKLIKKWWFWVIVVLIILVILLVTILFTNKDNGVGGAGISLEEFNKIELGMTMTEVATIINQKNINDISSEQISRVEDSYGTVYKYKYNGENKGYAIITYEYTTTDLWEGKGVKVILKENFNLK